MGHVQQPLGPGIQAKGIAGGGSGKGDGAAKGRRDGPVHMARQNPHHLWMAAQKGVQFQTALAQTLGRAARHAGTKRRVMQGHNGGAIGCLAQAGI